MDKYYGYNKALLRGEGDSLATDHRYPLQVTLNGVGVDSPKLHKDWHNQTDKDWRHHSPSIVTKVKSQGNCGSCWAFAASEVMESFIARRTGVLMELSPQQLVDCTPNPRQCGGEGGCLGATVQLAFNYTINANGIDGNIS